MSRFLVDQTETCHPYSKQKDKAKARFFRCIITEDLAATWPRLIVLLSSVEADFKCSGHHLYVPIGAKALLRV